MHHKETVGFYFISTLRLLEEVDMNKNPDWKIEEVVLIMKHVDHICKTKSTLGSPSNKDPPTFKKYLYAALLKEVELPTNLTIAQLERIRKYLGEVKTNAKLNEFAIYFMLGRNISSNS